MPTQGHFFSDFSDSKVLLKRTQHVLYFLKAVMNVMKFMKVMKVMKVDKGDDGRREWNLVCSADNISS